MKSSEMVDRWAWTKHPLLILLVGTAVGSIVIPRWAQESARETRLAELRTEYAQVALRTGRDVDRKLNVIITAFTTFLEEEVKRGNPDENARRTLQARVYTAYAEFEHDAWWWHWQFLQDVHTLRLAPTRDREDEINQACHDYQDNISKTVDVVNRYRDALISNRQYARGLSEREENERRLGELLRERQGIVVRLANPLTRAAISE